MRGPRGRGKGRQAGRCARQRETPKSSTGDILREAVHDKTASGARAKAITDRGELVGDEVMIGIVRERIGRPDDMAGIALFLASWAGSYLTGALIPVAGGLITTR